MLNHIIFYLILYLELKTAVEGAALILPPQKKPAEFECLEGCYVPSLGKVLPYSKPVSPKDGKSCTQYTCDKDGYTSIFTCGAIAAEENCTVVPGNLYLAYPDCCSTVKCKSDGPTTNKPQTDPKPGCVYPQPVEPAASDKKVPPRKRPIICRAPEDPVLIRPILNPPVEGPIDEPLVERLTVVDNPVETLPVIDPSVEKPPVVDPPVKNPPVVDPPVKNPPVVDPPVKNPPVIDPPVESPTVIDPPVITHPIKLPPWKPPTCPPHKYCIDPPVTTAPVEV